MSETRASEKRLSRPSWEPSDGFGVNPASWVDNVAAIFRSGANTLDGDETRRGFVPWATNLWLEGQRLSFDRFPWMEGVYADRSKRIVCRKGAQLGWTIWAGTRSMYGLLTIYRSVIYYFPTKGAASEFAQARINPLISDNDQLSRHCSSTNNLSVKRIGPGYIYFRGMRGVVSTKSTNADCVVFDERDEMDPDAVARAMKRLEASLIGHSIEIGNPTFPEYGIDREFQSSDQRYWHLRCVSCGKWDAPDLHFPLSLGKEIPCILYDAGGKRARLRCTHCKDGLLDPKQPGRWIAMRPSPDRPHGYTVSQLVRPDLDVANFVKEYQETDRPSPFFNLGMGMPYIDATNRVTKEEVYALASDEPMQTAHPGPCTMGIDTGKDFHWVVTAPSAHGFKRDLVAFGIAANYADLDDVMLRYNVRRFVADAMPEVFSTREWIDKYHRGSGWRCYFDIHRKDAPAWDDEERKVNINRTEALDASRAIIRKKEIRLPRKDERMLVFADHLEGDAKRLVEDPDTGSKTYEYLRTKANHFSLALTYDTLLWRWGAPVPAGSSARNTGVNAVTPRRGGAFAR